MLPLLLLPLLQSLLLLLLQLLLQLLLLCAFLVEGLTLLLHVPLLMLL